MEEKFIVHLLNDGFMKWLYEKRMDDCSKQREDKTNVENEGENIRKYTTENSRRELMEYKFFTQKG